MLPARRHRLVVPSYQQSEVDDRVRQAAETIYQALIEAELEENLER